MYGTLVGFCLPPGRVKKEAVGVVLVLGVVEPTVGACASAWELLAPPLVTGVVVVLVTAVEVAVVGCLVECSLYLNA